MRKLISMPEVSQGDIDHINFMIERLRRIDSLSQCLSSFQRSTLSMIEDVFNNHTKYLTYEDFAEANTLLTDLLIDNFLK